ncbi:MAG: UDP-N-acetylmuramoylalanine--D-glutamate ligase [Candidatus Pacebacteria bacterium RIFCSPHIGHO2_01_FULL_46_16]|nr:MAG: UDP-N-acetylmuramoylalanine--D-glutamate ligase [Candidatus Pacebacteria bacterium RIFCSPHIGHO2_01_FULL_46_16]OGJ21252.1 MAG: UDP-N-acetylmuramoylalanine--D-glutamate ligase [Candidatus Pacebacteria bacterium RIFCSPHIGHO2_02_FULL_46_9]OGJ38769.1 MAG: UDP-N-acetylmuramoylalanine--D-glutamate ligase [Candidatus Pacebacteria bacterium RIFCSPLOWO2_01_FULL_47_12]
MKVTVIFGLGREGLSSYHHLRSQAVEQHFLLVDDAGLAELDPVWGKILATHERVRFLPSPSVTEADLREGLLVKSPGIPHSHPICKLAQSLGLQVTSNTQLFFEYLETNAPSTLTIGVTGTKGKSTTTALIHYVLVSAQLPALLAGNIGEPALNLVVRINELIAKHQRPIVVLELSSHQLMDLTYSPQIAVILNITPEHLDYYATFTEYTQAKSAICCFQRPEDLLIYDPTNQSLDELVALSPAEKIYFADVQKTEQTWKLAARLEHDTIFSQDKPVIDAKKLPLTGRHQWLNALPSVIIGKHLGLSQAQIAKALVSFQPLPHRLELVAQSNGVRYYNDSQATTPEAAIAALRSFPKNQVVLIAGGSEKYVDLSLFSKEIIEHGVLAVALFPPTGKVIREQITMFANQLSKPKPDMQLVHSMQEAMNFAKQHAQPNNVVLLSPACASFGIFKNYQDRGEQFRSGV